MIDYVIKKFDSHFNDAEFCIDYNFFIVLLPIGVVDLVISIKAKRRGRIHLKIDAQRNLLIDLQK